MDTDRKPRHQSEPLPPRAGSAESESESEGEEREKVAGGAYTALKGSVRPDGSGKEKERMKNEDKKTPRADEDEMAPRGSRGGDRETSEVS